MHDTASRKETAGRLGCFAKELGRGSIEPGSMKAAFALSQDWTVQARYNNNNWMQNNNRFDEVLRTYWMREAWDIHWSMWRRLWKACVQYWMMVL